MYQYSVETIINSNTSLSYSQILREIKDAADILDWDIEQSIREDQTFFWMESAGSRKIVKRDSENPNQLTFDF